MKNTVYALDATTIDLCLSVFPWAPFRSTKAAVKLHTLLDLRGNIPSFIFISDGKFHEVNVLDQLVPEPGAFYVMDRGYIDFERLGRLHQAGSFFVTRAKSNFQASRRYSATVDRTTGLVCDQTVVLTGYYSRKGFREEPLRRIKFNDPESGKRLVFLTNNFALPAFTITQLYRLRWQVELFFKWMEQEFFSDQGVLRHQRERGQVTSLDRGVRLRAGGHRQETARYLGKPVRDPTNPESHDVRANAAGSTAYDLCTGVRDLEFG